MEVGVQIKPRCRNLARCLLWMVLGCVMLGGITACGSISKLTKATAVRARSMVGGKVEVQIVISPKANQNSPVAVDLLFVYDDKLMERLLGMPAVEWFEKRRQIRRDYVRGEGFDSWEWEWVPGQAIPVQKLPLKPTAIGAVVFGKSHSEGPHRYRIDPFKGIIVLLGEKAFLVRALTEANKGKPRFPAAAFED